MEAEEFNRRPRDHEVCVVPRDDNLLALLRVRERLKGRQERVRMVVLSLNFKTPQTDIKTVAEVLFSFHDLD